MLRARVAPTGEVPAVLTFLADNGYPHKWTAEQLQSCLVVRVANLKRTVAYFWFNWVDLADLSMEMHFCAAPGSRFLSHAVLRDMTTLCTMMSCKLVIARTLHPGLVKLLAYAGFENAGQFSYLRIEENL